MVDTTKGTTEALTCDRCGCTEDGCLCPAFVRAPRDWVVSEKLRTGTKADRARCVACGGRESAIDHDPSVRFFHPFQPGTPAREKGTRYSSSHDEFNKKTRAALERVHNRVFNYDGAIHCYDCGVWWGVLPGNPVMPEQCYGLPFDRRTDPVADDPMRAVLTELLRLRDVRLALGSDAWLGCLAEIEERDAVEAARALLGR